MADAKKDDKKDDKAAPDPAAAAKKLKLLIAGGAVAVLALAFVAASMAVPKEVVKPQLLGPYVAPLTPSKLQVNLSDGRGYLVLSLNVKYEAYAPDYVPTRTADPVCNAELKDQLVAISSAKSRQDINDKVLKPVYLEEVRQAVEPLLFPVHFGMAAGPSDADVPSGVAPGETTPTFRGLFEDHKLTIDNIEKKIALDDGEPVAFTGEERDLAVSSSAGIVYVNVTGLVPEFKGDVQVGVKGRVKRILLAELLTQ